MENQFPGAENSNRKYNSKNKRKNIIVNLKHFEARRGLPFGNNYFDAIYSHMFYNMSFTNEDPRFLFTESNKVLKNNGLLYFSA